MLSHAHALSGVTAGAAAGIFAFHLAPAPLALLTGLTAAYALAPDIDHCSATESRTFGFVTESLAWTVGKLSGGHRHLTHSAIGVAAFTAVAWIACHYRDIWPGRIGLAVILAVGFAAALEALRIGGHFGNAIAVAGAVAMIWSGYGLELVPLAAAIGTATHIAGDMLTESGCMVFYPLSKHRFHLLPRGLTFITGTWPEYWIVTPLLTGGLVVVLAYDAGAFPVIESARHYAAARLGGF